MPTINQLTAVDTVTASDLIPIWSSTDGDARKTSANTLKNYISTDVELINPDIGTPSAGNLINCIGLPLAGGGTGASTAIGARSNLGAAKSGANSDITSLTGLNSLQVTGTNGTATIGATGDQLAFGYDGLNYITASGANATLQIQASGATGKLTFGTAASERMRIDNAGNVSIGGTGNAAWSLLINKAITGGTAPRAVLANGAVQSDATSNAAIFSSNPSTAAAVFTLPILYHYHANQGTIGAGSAITNQYGFHAESTLVGATNNYGFFGNIASGTGRWNFYAAGTADSYFASNNFIFANGGTERARFDSAGRLLVGTSTSTALLGYNSGAQFAAGTGTISLIRNTANNGAIEIVGAKSRGTSGTPAIVSADDGLFLNRYTGYDGASYIEAARISALVDGTPTLNSMPGRLVFSTTADGASSPTERMRIDSAGNILIGTITSPLAARVYVNSTEARIQSRNTTSGANGYIGALLTNEWRGAWSTTNTPITFGTNDTERMRITSGGDVIVTGVGGLGYGTGSGGAVTQLTSRATGVTLNKTNGAITMFSAAGSATAATFTVTNSTVAATDVVHVSVKSATNVYLVFVTATATGSFNITFQTTGGTAVDAPVFNFAVIKAVTA